ALALYDYRAKVKAVEGSMQQGPSLGYFFQYPPYTSLLHVFSYIFSIDRPKIIYSCLYLSFLITFFALLRRSNTSSIALTGTLLLAIDTFVFRHSTMAYTNLPYVIFLS